MPTAQTYPIDPFTQEGAKRIAAIAGQQPKSISADQLTGGSAVRLPQAVEAPLPTTPSIPSVDSIFDVPETETQRKASGLQTSIAGTEGELAGETAYRTSQEQANDISGKKKTANDLTTQLNNLKTEADQIPLSLQNDATGRGITAAGLAPIQAGELRKNAIRQLGVSAMLQAANGNLATAQDMIDSAVKAKFDPIKAELAAKKAQLDAITPLLNAEESKRAAKQAAQLAERSRLLTKAESDQTTIYQTMLSAAQSGADAITLRSIQNATSPAEAVRFATKALGAKYADDKKQQEFENNIALAQLAIDQQKANNEGSGAASADPIQMLAYAQQYASTGKIPTGLPKGTFGVVSQLAKELPKPDGTLIDTNTGTKPDIADAKIDGLAALYDISQKVDQLKELDTQRNHGLVSGALSKTFGTTDSQKYVDLRTEIIDLLSRARTGAALTAGEEKFYTDQLPGRVSNVLGLGANSQLRIDNFASKINGTLETKLKANQTAIVGFSSVNIGGQQYKVGEIVKNAAGQQGRVNADGSITLIQ
jgi:hypothetical protein